MSQKHKLEEFHDPDYPQEQNAKRRRLGVLSADQRLEKIRAIIEREFSKELSKKEDEVTEIDNRITICKQLLHKVRYAVVAEYYNKNKNKALVYTENEAAQIQNKNSLFQNETKGPQIAIHPALKEVLSKNPADYEELMRVRPTREAAKTAKTSIKEKLRSKKEEMRLQRQIRESGIVIDHCNPNKISEPKVENKNPVKIPRYIEPVSTKKIVPTLNSARGSNQFKHLIVVGNTSKYIGDEKPSDRTTHKWLIYVQTKTSVPIEKFVNNVRFFLHSSYRPNDVVDVSTPPYHLARRGWGEFPVRMQLFFDPKLQQKPIHLVHHLVLDKTLSGLQTMGAETLVEIWLRSGHLQPIENTETIDTILKPEIGNYSKAEIDENLFDFLNKIEESSTECPDIDKIEPTVIDSPIIDSSFTRKALGLPPFNNINTALKKLEEDENNPTGKSSIKKDTHGDLTQTLVNTITHESTPSIVEQNNLTNQLELNNTLTPSPTAQKIEKFVPPLSKAIPSICVSTNTIKNSTTILSNGVNKVTLVPTNNILQKKILKFVDRDGNVKTVQMFVSPSNKSMLSSKIQTQNVPVVNKINEKIHSNGDKLKTNEQTSSSVTLINNKQNCPVSNGNQNKIVLINGAKVSGIMKNNQPKNQLDSSLSISSQTPLLYRNGTSVKPIVTPSSSLDISTKSSTSVNTITSRPTGQLPKKQIFQKNGIMYIIDPLQSKLKQQQKNQESLLKPQVTLLKTHGQQILPNVTKSNSSIIIDHDYTPTTVKNNQHLDPFTQYATSSNLQNNKVLKPFALIKKQRRNYLLELETKFFACQFSSVRSAVEYLLRRLMLVNNLAKDSDFKYCYPFVVASMDEFCKMKEMKQKAAEWLRAKYISKIVRKHSGLKNKSTITNNNKDNEEEYCNQYWSTKEIVCFARQHAYTPVISGNSRQKLRCNMSSNTITSYSNRLHENNQNNETLTDLVKKELKKEKYNCQSVTLCHNIYKWINKTQDNVNKKLDNDILIVVDEIDVEKQDENDIKTKINHMTPMKFKNQKLWVPVPEILENEARLATDICQEIGIRLNPEEIEDDIVYPSSEIVLAQTLRLFIEDLIRRSVAIKSTNDTEGTSTDTILQLSDIVNAINTRNEFDFLTNKNLGVMKIKDGPD